MVSEEKKLLNNGYEKNKENIIDLDKLAYITETELSRVNSSVMMKDQIHN